MAFVAHDQAAEVAESGEEAFHLPATAIPPERTSVLGLGTRAAAAVGCDHLDAQQSERFIERIGIVGPIADEALGHRGYETGGEGGDNRKVYGFGLLDWRDGWFDGRVATGRTADVFCEQVRSAVTRSKQRGRVAIVIADNLRTHTSAGSLLVRSMLTELKEHLYLVYTPAYDPDANRIEWLWRVSRRVVTHNHHRNSFDLLLKDLQTHFQALA